MVSLVGSNVILNNLYKFVIDMSDNESEVELQLLESDRMKHSSTDL
jgi:hypothetical protein